MPFRLLIARIVVKAKPIVFVAANQLLNVLFFFFFTLTNIMYFILNFIRGKVNGAHKNVSPKKKSFRNKYDFKDSLSQMKRAHSNEIN